MGPFVPNGRQNSTGTLRLERSSEGPLRVVLEGDWQLEGTIPSVDDLRQELESGSGGGGIVLDGAGLGRWDSALLTFLTRCRLECDRTSTRVEAVHMPEGVRRLLDLASAVSERKGARRGSLRASWVARVGDAVLSVARSSVDVVTFVGELAQGVGAFVRGRAQYRRSELWVLVQDSGARAFGIVSLISALLGLILAFIGAAQLEMFGAQIYVANLVGIAMARELGAVMTAVIMAGRTGAAYAAKIGTMQVNEEVDALRTLGVSPLQFLVVPRVLALAVMMPLLTLYADFMGILGGGVVATGAFDITVTQFIQQTRAAVPLHQFAIGLFKSVVYGVIVAVAGCYQGLRCGRSASAVGEATTAAVVQSIVWIVVACAAMTVLCDALGI